MIPDAVMVQSSLAAAPGRLRGSAAADTTGACPRGVLHALAVLCLLAVMAAEVRGQEAPEVFAAPALFGAGAEVRVVALHLGVRLSYELWLQPQAAGVAAVRIHTEFAAPADGEFDELLTLPGPGQLPAGAYALELREVRAGVVATSDVQVLAPLVVAVEPASAPAGALVTVDVTGLEPGQLIVDYAGVPVLGPLSTAGGSFRGEFHVPLDRPDGFGATTVSVRNLSRRIEQQRGSAAFFAQRPLTSERAALLSLDGLPTHPLRPGESFALSGRIATRAGNPERLQLEPMLSLASGITVPLLAAPASINGDGFFAVTIQNPNLALNHGVLASSGRIKLVLRAPPAPYIPTVAVDAFAGMPTLVETGIHSQQGIAVGSVDAGQVQFLPSINDLRIRLRVLRAPEGHEPGPQPLANARVVVATRADLVDPNSFGPSSASAFSKAATGGSSSAANASFGSANQIQFLEQATHQAVQLDWLTGCAPELFRGYSDSNGEFEIVLNRDTLMVKTHSNFVTINGQTFTSLAPLAFEIAINALPEGYGECDPARGGRCGATIVLARYNFKTDEFEIQDPLVPDNHLGQGKDWDLPVVLAKLPADANIGLVTEASFLGLPLQGAKTYRPITSLASVPNALIDKVEPLFMRFGHNANLYGPLASASLWRSSGPGGVFIQQAAINLADALDGPKCVEGDDEVHYKVAIPNAHKLAAGSHVYEVRFVVSGAAALEGRSQRLTLTAEPPPTWFGRTSTLPASLLERRVTSWRPSEVKLFGLEVPQEERKQDGNFESTENEFTIPGTVENRSNRAPRIIRETLTATGDSAYSTEQTSTNRGASRDSAPTKKSGTLSKSSISAFGSPAFQSIIDTGRIPLFRMSWGFWPLAGALIGADAWFAAFYKYYGTLEMLLVNNSDPSVKAVVQAALKLEAGVELFMDISILFNLIRVRGEATGLVALGLETEISSVDGAAPTAENPLACIRLAILFAVRASAGWCPFCIEAFKQVTALDQTRDPENAGIDACYIERIDAFKLPKTAATPPSFNDKQPVSIEDNKALGMRVWVKDGFLWYQPLSNGKAAALKAPMTPRLTCNTLCNSATSPALGVLGPNRFVLAWAEARSTFGDGGNLWDKTRDYRIYYRVWSNGAWSDAARLNNDALTIGEGSVHLASCPSWEAGCPGQGEVSAVWSRELQFGPSIDILGQSHVFYSRFRSVSGAAHTWTSPAQISTGLWQNNVARTVYGRVLGSGGSVTGRPPIVFWVNSASSQIKDTNQRRIHYRFPLVGDSQPQIAGSTSLGVGWMDASVGEGTQVHLAYTVGEAEVAGFMGNQQEVFTARASCSPASGCNFNQRRVRDQHGRTVRGENVQVSAGSNGKTTVHLRGLGYGKNASGFDYFANDATGLKKSTGDIISITQGYGSLIEPGHVAAITTDGALHWNLATSVSSGGDTMLTSVSVAQVTPKRQALLRMAGHRNPEPLMKLGAVDDEDLVFGELPAAPNFSVDNISAIDVDLQPGKPFEVVAVIGNSGLAHAGVPITVVATWDGPHGIGIPAAEVALDAIEQGVTRLVTLQLAVPADFLPEERHLLSVAVNPSVTIMEQTMVDNARTLEIGGLAAPNNVVLGGGAGHSSVFLAWDAPTDPNVSTVRVYRQDGDGPMLAIGSSPVNGFLDLGTEFEKVYMYYVANVSPNGVESALVGPLPILLVQPPGIFADSFEQVIDPDL
jgi:hypothetical protein